MRLFTVQGLEVYRALEKQGYYVCDERKAKCLKEMEFHWAYDFMREEMIKRIGAPKAGVKYPIWAWHTLRGKRKSDLRYLELTTYAGDMVCLEIEIPSEKALLSDEIDWHCVLNDYCFPEGESEEEIDAYCRNFDRLSMPEQKAAKRASWQAIFLSEDEALLRDYVQATFWELKADEVIGVKFYRGRL